LELLLLLSQFDLSLVELFFLLFQLFSGLLLSQLALSEEPLLLLGLELSGFLVLSVTRLLAFFESYSFSSLNLLLKLKSIGLLEHPHLFVLGGVADSPSLLHSADFPL
jgi:hypothetical protein